MNLKIYGVLRNINCNIKARRKRLAGQIMSPVRRIEGLYPPTERVCAMTFDDGPTTAPCLPNVHHGSLTPHLLDVLKQYNATATFDVIGSTAENYPDVIGAPHTHSVFGTKFDHYAAFEQDALAGVEACPDLLRRMISEGHEVANHSYRHRIFGAEYFIYRKRQFCRTQDDVVADLRRLHDKVLDLSGYEMKLARPPHYVDRIGRGRRLSPTGKHNAYTAYATMCYHYMAANVDGGGYMPTSGNYNQDVQNMVTPLRRLLEADSNALSGAVIFQKDGYNMSIQSPVADALGLQLQLLQEYGYRITGVETLMKLSPFEDVVPDDPCLKSLCDLEAAGYCLGFQNNTFKPDDPISQEQLAAMLTPRRNFTAKKISQRAALTPIEIQRQIAAKFGDCAPVKEANRRAAVIAIWDAVQNF
ncbi:MAG: polysaccharide deacetylase family protein [Oscillospiraceae bacterium]|nr:polysaccharide deacetylase family protein [Oscillospiraceae bacterium]